MVWQYQLNAAVLSYQIFVTYLKKIIFRSFYLLKLHFTGWEEIVIIREICILSNILKE